MKRITLGKMMADERQAPKEYHRLKKKLKCKSDKKVIQGIIRQERRHLAKLKRIKRKHYHHTRYCGCGKKK
jgi:rubrerythrin